MNCRRWQPAVSCRDLSTGWLRKLLDAGISVIEALPIEVQPLPAEERPERYRQIARNIRDAGIGVWSVHIPFGTTWDISVLDPALRQIALANVRGALDFCRMLRPRRAVIHGSAEPIPDAERAARIRASQQSLKELTPEFTAAGLLLALEVLPRTCLGNTADELLQLTRDIPGIGFCLDTNHLMKGETHAQFLSKLASRIVTVHCSDYDGEERHWLPGEGSVPWQQICQTLEQAGYEGPFVFETRVRKDGQAIRPEEYVPALRKLGVG
jgi:sugar phosphate isomerase/epimerase